MPKKNETYAMFAAEIDALLERRETVITNVFDQFEKHDNLLANLLKTTLANRRQAALWMCQPSRRLGGKNAYQALAEGDYDAVWDLLLTQSGHQETVEH